MKPHADTETVYLPGSSRPRSTNGLSHVTVLLLCIGVGVFGVFVGLMFGFFGKSSDDLSNKYENLVIGADPKIAERLGGEIDAERIRYFHSQYASLPHIAGSDADFKTAQQVAETWKKQGLDSVEIIPYKVLLSYPDEKKLNKVEIKNVSGDVIYSSAIREEPLTEKYNHERIVKPYNAYSPSGVVEGELVYVNYGSDLDFKRLKQLGIEVKDRVVIARHGVGFRGDKVRNAEKAGAIGMILYSDVFNEAEVGKGNVYPNSWWLPETGAQRGSINTIQGDPATQGIPATEYTYRTPLKTLHTFLPKIPCQPVGYRDARELLRHLDGPEVPTYWQGGLDIGKYRIGPGFRASSGRSSVRLEVNNYLDNRTIYNVIGRINGAVETDRYVLLSNHRDAWVYGALDPISGTAAIMEIARVLAKLAIEGLRPRRSIMFCSWSAEEFGLIGSTEFVEQKEKLLMARAVAVLNVDTAVKGNRTLAVRATSALHDAIHRAARKVPAPFVPGKSLYEVWDTQMPFKRERPTIMLPDSSTDYAPFLQQIGIEVLDMSYIGSTGSYASNPLYHTRYETIHLTNLIDPDFKCHKAITHMWAVLARDLADSVTLPLNISNLAKQLSREASQSLKYQEERVHRDVLRVNEVTFAGIYSATLNLTKAAREFHKRLGNIKKMNPFEVRMVNDQMIQVMRAFIHHGGLPGRPHIRNQVFAPLSKNMYLGSIFPGIYDLLSELEEVEEGASIKTKIHQLKRHISILTTVIQSAVDIVTP